jgi:hypothetical protein
VAAPQPPAWPALRYEDWANTCETLKLWLQIAGKVRMGLCAPLNHWWHVTLYVSGRGLTTGAVPCGDRAVELVFDFIDHRFRISCSDGARREIALEPRTTADFYGEVTEALAALRITTSMWPVPSEVAEPIPFARDETHRAYDANYANRFWRVLVQADRVMGAFRARFIGKASPVHLFWGAMDLAVTRFSGRRAPEHPGNPMLPDWVTREAYSHEVSSCGFWPGAPGVDALFYAYAYPDPPGFAQANVEPGAARWEPSLGEFVLPYEAVRQAADPDAALDAFLQSTYAAAAGLGKWDRAGLERVTAGSRASR